VAAQPDGFFVDCHLVRKNGGFGENPAFINGSICQHLLELLIQPGAVIRHGLGVAAFHLGHQRPDGVAPTGQIGLQRRALLGAHGIKAFQGMTHHLHHVGHELFLVHLGLVHGEHIAHLGQQGYADVLLDVKLLCHLAHGLNIARGYLPVQADGYIRHTLGSLGDEYIHFAPGDGSLDCLLHRILRKGEGAWELDGAIQIPIVDTADFNSEFPSVHRLHTAAIAGHAFHHGDIPLFKVCWSSRTLAGCCGGFRCRSGFRGKGSCRYHAGGDAFRPEYAHIPEAVRKHGAHREGGGSNLCPRKVNHNHHIVGGQLCNLFRRPTHL